MKFSLQPDQLRFFEEISTCLETGAWTEFAIAVAWARENAVASLKPVLRQFLEIGGRFRITVGIGLQGTSREALGLLLDLETFGNSETFVYHNEAAEETFHPKIFLFTAQHTARLIVGSSNLTDGGLATNIEAAIDLETPIGAEAVVQAAECLAGLRNVGDSRVRRLTNAFLAELVTAGYVLPEAELRTRRAAQARTPGPQRRVRPRLFGTVHRPRLPRAARVQAQVVEATVLLVRPRRASETARRTQIQIPIRLTRTAFFTGVTSIVGAHDNRMHPLVRATARGGLNTVKVELPEIDTIVEPVLRLTRRGDRITYEAFSSDSDLGRPIMDALQAGLEIQPPVTVATILDQQRATLYRFV